MGHGQDEGMGTRGEPNKDEVEGVPEGLSPSDVGYGDLDGGSSIDEDKIDRLLADPTTRDYLKRKLQGL